MSLKIALEKSEEELAAEAAAQAEPEAIIVAS
jgi:hypothetical protein